MARGPRVSDDQGAAFIIRVKAGLFTQEHFEAMGSAIWLFGALLNMQTKDDGTVYHGRPITYSLISEWTGFDERTLRRWMRFLRVRYIKVTRKHDGFVVRILNPASFERVATSGRSTRPAKRPHLADQTGQTATSGRSPTDATNAEPAGACGAQIQIESSNAFDPAVESYPAIKQNPSGETRVSPPAGNGKQPSKSNQIKFPKRGLDEINAEMKTLTAHYAEHVKTALRSAIKRCAMSRKGGAICGEIICRQLREFIVWDPGGEAILEGTEAFLETDPEDVTGKAERYWRACVKNRAQRMRGPRV